MDSETGILLGEIKGKLDLFHEDTKSNFGDLFERVGEIESNTAVLSERTDNQEGRLKKVEHTIGKAIVIAASLAGGIVGVPKLMDVIFK